MIIICYFICCYRKLLRAINFVGTEYPQIYSSDVSASMALVNTAYGSFGDLNDLITGTFLKASHNIDILLSLAV